MTCRAMIYEIRLHIEAARAKQPHTDESTQNENAARGEGMRAAYKMANLWEGDSPELFH